MCMFTYPKRRRKDLYAGSRTSATASLKDSRNSLSGTVHWDCLWWISSNSVLNVLNLSFTIALDTPAVLLLSVADWAPWIVRHCRICQNSIIQQHVSNILYPFKTSIYPEYRKKRSILTIGIISSLEIHFYARKLIWNYSSSHKYLWDKGKQTP